MTGVNPLPLSDRCARALEDGPLPCERLARTVKARTAEVRQVLRDDPRFERVGTGRWSRWQLAAVIPDTPRLIRDGLGRIESNGSMPIDGLTDAERLDAIERRLDALERRNGYAETLPA
jgi:hypothetical protein